MTLGEFFLEHVPTYKSRSWRSFEFTFDWDPAIADFMETVSAKRCASRRTNYIIPGEFDRAKESIRFGVSKPGHGYHGDRGDFCLVGGVHRRGHLHLFYRSLELIGGLHYDTAIIRQLEHDRGSVKKVHVYAVTANSFCLKGNSNEKLYPKLKSFYANQS